MPAAIEVELLNLLAVFILAAIVGIGVAKVGRFPYTIALLLAGLGASVLGVEFGITLSHDIILLVLLPPLLFEGAATTDLGEFRSNLGPILALAIPGLLISIVVLGLLGEIVFGFPLLIALLFAAMILPTDPVSVLALFAELGAPDRLVTLVEGESLVNDGVGVVVFSTLLALIMESAPLIGLEFGPSILAEISLEIALASVGGAAVGIASGYLVFRVMANLDEHMTEIILTAILAYGSFLIAEHYLGVSGVIATVVAGLLIGNRGAEFAMSPQTKISIFNTWETAAFIVNTFIFVAIGTTTPVGQLLEHAWLIAVAIPFVLLARAVVVYPVSMAVNRVQPIDLPWSYQHVLVWGGLHGSIPIALVLGLPQTLPTGAPFPFREELRAMVFGVAAFSLVVQGLSMGRVLDTFDVVTRSEAEALYELLRGRARAVDAALDAADTLRGSGELSPSTYNTFTSEYEREQTDLEAAIRELLLEYSHLRTAELRAGERQVLQREKSAVIDAIRTGVVSDDVGERLIEEIDIKLDRLRSGESTVERGDEGYEEFWRSQAAEFGLEWADSNSREDGD